MGRGGHAPATEDPAKPMFVCICNALKDRELAAAENTRNKILETARDKLILILYAVVSISMKIYGNPLKINEIRLKNPMKINDSP